MDFLQNDHLDDIDKSRNNWKIKVRVTRMWPTVASETGTNRGCNLIMLDDDNSHVHAFAYADVWNNIGNDVVEGGVYILHNFSVRDPVGNLKPVSAKYTIRLQSSTKFSPCDEDNLIPDHKFEFLDLGDLFKEASRFDTNEIPDYAIDVIGVVEDFENCKTIGTKFGEREIVRFRLCDKSNRHRVAVWGDLAKTVQEDYGKEFDRPLIAVITSTKLSTYKNSVQITTLPSSKVYFNLKDDSVVEMRQRLEQDGYGLRTTSDEINYSLSIVQPYAKVYINNLIINPAENSKEKIFCTFSINSVTQGFAWYLNSCSICHAEVQKLDNIFNCVVCNRNIPVSEKRFRVNVIVNDETATSTFYLMDRVVKRITGISASMLIKNHVNDTNNVEGIPTVLATLIGQVVTVIVDVIQNPENSEYIFQAVDIYDDSLYVSAPSESSPPPDFPPNDFPTINLTDSFDEIEAGKTPGSAKSVSKKMKTEK